MFQLQVVETVLPYHQLMTPSWLLNHATIAGPYILTPQYLEISPTTGDINQRALNIKLIAPDTLTNADCISVTVIAAFDAKLATNDHDPQIGISDGTYFTGFFIADPATTIPVDGESGQILNNGVSGGRITASQYPSEIKLQFKPTENWKSAYDNENTLVEKHQNTLDLTKGLYLELYRNHATEKLHIRYIVVDVKLD